MIRMTRISKRYYLRQIVACWLVCYMLLGIPAQVATADTSPLPDAVPSPGNLTSAVGAGITDTAANWLEVTQTAQEAIMNWNNFDIGENSAVEFIQPDATAAVLNRVSDAGGTGIMGSLTANGRVFIINPAGLLFGSGVSINVSRLVASSLDIDDADFINGMPYTFTGGLNAGDVTNEGSIGSTKTERIALIAKNVINRGTLVANECVIMAAGDTVLISEDSPVAVEVTMGADWAPDDYSFYQAKNEEGEISAEHVVLAAGDVWSAALVTASASGSEAVATIDIDAAGDVTVTNEVVAEAFGNGENDAVATVTVNSGGDVDVIGDDGVALIQAKTLGGTTNTSKILICADGQVTVKAEGVWYDDDDWPYAGSASIEAIAGSVTNTTLNNTAMAQNNTAITMAQKNTADVQIGAGEGINVTATGDEWLAEVSKASASIKAEAAGGVENTAGILACANGDVQVIAGVAGEATINSVAGAFQGTSSNAETTVISRTGDVVVNSSLGGRASIESVVYGDGTTTATTQVYATDVEVTGQDASIKAVVPGDAKIVPGDAAPDPLATDYCLTEDGAVAKIDEDGSTLIIDGSDCPDCPPCPCEEEELLAPVAPLAQFEIPRVEGCPELTQAAAMELGITGETLQVAIGNALALNPTIQPCEACATLVNAASILRDEDGSRMAAMVQTFNTLAPADAPFTPEMATSIAMAFEGAAEGTQYASAMEYVDAFVQYVAVLDIELGSPVGDDSVAFVMEKYGTGITASDNANMTAFVITRLEAIGE